MSKLKRKIITSIFILLFLVLAPIILFYANGHILSEGFNILATGGVFIRSMDSGSKVFINNKLKTTTSFFTRDYFLKNLRPGVYDILVTKEGYNEWANKLKVYPNRVSESRVFMLPQKINFVEIAEYLILDTASTSVVTKPESNPEYELISNLFVPSTTTVKIKTKNLATSTVDISDFPSGSKENPLLNRSFSLWKEENDIYLGWTGNTDSSPKIFCEEIEDIILCKDKIKVYNFSLSVGDFDYFLNDTEIVIVSSGENIYAVEVGPNPLKKLQLLYKGEKPEFRIFKNNIYIKDINLLGRLEF